METRDPESVDEVVRDINRVWVTAFESVGRLEGGHQSGAYLLREGKDSLFVLKVTEGTGRLKQLEKVRPLVETMRARGYPMPELLFIGTLEDEVTYSVREFVPGDPLTVVNEENANLFLELIEMQRDVRLDIDHDWSAWVDRVLLGEETNYPTTRREHSAATSELWDEIEKAVQDRIPMSMPVTDMVHGDFRPANVVVKDGRVAGVIDYEYAGKGCRVIDLVTLIGDGMVADPTSPVQRRLWREGIGIVGEEVLLAVLLYHSVEMIYWFMLKTDETRLKAHVATAKWALERL